MKKVISALIVVSLVLAGSALAQHTKIVVDTAAEGTPIGSDLYGIFFEEINHSGDGGIYAEMVENRSFEDYRVPEGLEMKGNDAVGPNKGWRVYFDAANKFPHWNFNDFGNEAFLSIDTQSPIHPNNPSYACVKVSSVKANSSVVLSNDGFWGVAIFKDATYKLSLFAKSAQNAQFEVKIVSGENVLAKTAVSVDSAQWKKYEFSLTGLQSASNGVLQLVFSQPTDVCLDEISLFPTETWKNRPNGLRKDLAQKLNDLKPAFVRFPGGCIVEGCTLANAFRPSTTLGPNETRPSRWIVWNYRSPQGLGLHEYLQMCEDIGASAMLVVNCGMACEFRDGGMVDDAHLQPYIDDALNSIEYAIGPTSSKFGAMRAAAGHPEPFNLKYVEIGNENWGSEYRPRYKVFQAALKAKYPQLKYISCIEIEDADVDIRDDHYYNTPEFFRQNAGRYDNESRTGREIYVGEFAVTRDIGEGNLRGALGEAAFMMGFERNGDLVTMSSYAPLFYNVNDLGWPVNLIGFDNYRCFGQPSYYVQQMFSTEKGDRALPTEVIQKANAAQNAQTPAGVAMAAWNTRVEYKDLVVTDAAGKEYKLDAAAEKALFAPLSQRAGSPVFIPVDQFKIAGDYTVKFKAKKIDGAEGFLFGFNVVDKDNYLWFNRGGFGNSCDTVEKIARSYKREIRSKRAPFTPVEAGRWYDYEIRVTSSRAVCCEDGKEIISCNPTSEQDSIVAIAHRDTASGDLLVRIVNYNETAEEVEIQLDKFTGKTNFKAEQTVLTSEKVTDRNTLEEPEKVAPKKSEFNVTGPNFTITVAPHSLTNLRLK